jgi:hypothetical protein
MRLRYSGGAVPRRRYIYPPAIILTVLVVGGMIVARAAGPRILVGRTAQNTSFELAVRGGHVWQLLTSLTATCGGGNTYQAHWSPTEGHPVHFNSHGQSFSTYEVAQRWLSYDVSGQIEFVLRGRLTSPSAARGTVRLIADLYGPGRKGSVCDSLNVPWSVTRSSTS